MEQIKDTIKPITGIQLHTEIWREGEMYVAYVPPLDLSSCGRTVEEAKKNIGEATAAFLETAQEMGTLKDILEEAGFSFRPEGWQAPKLVALEKVNLAL